MARGIVMLARAFLEWFRRTGFWFIESAPKRPAVDPELKFSTERESVATDLYGCIAPGIGLLPWFFNDYPFLYGNSDDT
jgi:hypothetical protein